MNKLFYLMVSIALISAIAVSCSSDDNNDNEISSSSEGTSSSSSENTPSQGCLTNNDETVKIGEQTWMKFNLSVEPSAGANNAATNSWCYDEKYGRLYDWATAMAMPEKCNSKANVTTDLDCKTSEVHQGICPDGYHIPNSKEWDKLLEYVGGKDVAARELKAKKGWTDCGDTDAETYECLDNYGFSALPGGMLQIEKNEFSGTGIGGSWWRAFDGIDDGDYEFTIIMNNEDKFYTMNNDVMYHGISVRCIKN